MPAPHPPEFRRRAVDLARLGEQPVAAIAKALGISESCLRNWMAQADADDGKNTARLPSDEKAELSELRKKARRHEVENEERHNRRVHAALSWLRAGGTSASRGSWAGFDATDR